MGSFASLSGLVSDIGNVTTWFWGIFTDFIDMIAKNNLLLWPVAFAICAGVVGLAIKVVRTFGIKGRR